MKEKLYAIGDIHGCINELRQLVESIARIMPGDAVVFLGDYIDRGENSREVIDYIMDMRNSGMDITTLRGNHEEMLIETYENDNKWYNWLLNGGSSTLDSFGIKNVKDLPREYVAFFYGLRYYYIRENYIFVHAGFNDDLENPFEDTNEMVWTRRENYRNPALKDFTIIHGHTPVALDVSSALIKDHSRVLNIDTGCVYAGTPGYGHLSAVELRSMTLFST